MFCMCDDSQGRTYPLGKGRRLPRAPKSQGPPKMLFIYEMRMKCGHENGVYYHDNRLRLRVEVLLVYPACSKYKYYASEADCRTSARSLFPSARTPLSLSLSLSASALYSERLKGAALSVKHRYYVASLILHAGIAEIAAQLLSLSYV